MVAAITYKNLKGVQAIIMGKTGCAIKNRVNSNSEILFSRIFTKFQNTLDRDVRRKVLSLSLSLSLRVYMYCWLCSTILFLLDKNFTKIFKNTDAYFMRPFFSYAILCKKTVINKCFLFSLNI